MSPRGILDLPEELILYIVSAACEGEPVTSIHKLLLVNRQFSRLALPFLYRNLSDDGHLSGVSVAIQKLIITLLFNPNKAELVRSFQVNQGEEFGNGSRLKDGGAELEEYGYTAEKRAEILRIVDIMEEHGGSDEIAARWRKDFVDEPLIGAFLALMLARLPNLRKFTLLDSYSDFWSIFGYVTDGLEAASKDPSTHLLQPFAKVENVTIGGENEECPLSTKPLTIIARWPSVTHIVSNGFGDSEDDDVDPDPWFLDLKPRSTNTTSITLSMSGKLLSEHLVRFLGTAKALETFSYTVGYDFGWTLISTPDLGRALDQHKNTLRELTLRFYDAVELEGMGLDVREFTLDKNIVFAPMCFDSYSTLKHLSISYELLFGFIDRDVPFEATTAQEHIIEALPASLRTLTITKCREEERVKVATSAISAILAMKQEKWLDLEKVIVAGWDAGWKLLEKMGPAMEAEGEGFGVSYMALTDTEVGTC